MLELVRARKTDVKQIVSLQRAAFQAAYATYQDAGNPVLMTEEGVDQRMELPGSLYQLIVLDGQAIGFIRTVEKGDQLRIAPLAILPAWQGKGYGRWAMEQIEREFPQVQTFLLDTILQEKGLCSFYEHLGYSRVGTLLELQEGMTLVDYMKKRKG